MHPATRWHTKAGPLARLLAEVTQADLDGSWRSVALVVADLTEQAEVARTVVEMADAVGLKLERPGPAEFRWPNGARLRLHRRSAPWPVDGLRDGSERLTLDLCQLAEPVIP